MVLIKCKECGQEISSKARVCLHCGVRNPAPFGFTFKRVMKIWAICAVVAAVGIIIIVSTSGGGTSSSSTASNEAGSTDGGDSSSAPSVPPPVFAGNKGQITDVTLGCPQKTDFTALMNDYAKAQAVNDTVGEHNAIFAANQAGCTFIPVGTKALVIANSGFLEQIDEIRLDDGQSYWINANMISPIPGQPDNP